jgi:N-acetyl-D-muramate 6-phosphate phosphatase
MPSLSAVLFDLDGTLADTAPDLGFALNRLLERYDRPTFPIELLRPQASHGARGLLQIGFGVRPNDPFYDELRDEFLQLYRENLCRETVLFPGVQELLTELERRDIPWGIVTNKPKRFTDPLILELHLAHRAACVVSGDSYARPKPFPDPLLGAAQELKVEPDEIVYVGDDERDMQAGLAAGMRVVVASYGYLGNENHPDNWQAHAKIAQPGDLIEYLDRPLPSR